MTVLFSAIKKWNSRKVCENGSLKTTTGGEQTTWKLPVTHDIPRSTGSQFGIGQNN